MTPLNKQTDKLGISCSGNTDSRRCRAKGYWTIKKPDGWRRHT